MKYATIIVGILVGLLFVAAAVAVLFHLVTPPPPPEGSAMAAFNTACGPTGYRTVVKSWELVGGVRIAIPVTRRAGPGRRTRMVP